MKTEERTAGLLAHPPEMKSPLSTPAQYDLFRALERARREIGGAELAKLLRYLALG